MRGGRGEGRTRIDQSCADELDRDTLRAEPLAVVGQTMKQRRWTTWLAGSLWATWFALVAMLVLIGTDPSRPLLAIAATFAMVTVGALVASRRPANPIGWIFCALGLGFMVGGVSSGYATRALVAAPGSRRAAPDPPVSISDRCRVVKRETSIWHRRAWSGIGVGIS